MWWLCLRWLGNVGTLSSLLLRTSCCTVSCWKSHEGYTSLLSMYNFDLRSPTVVILSWWWIRNSQLFTSSCVNRYFMEAYRFSCTSLYLWWSRSLEMFQSDLRMSVCNLCLCVAVRWRDPSVYGDAAWGHVRPSRRTSAASSDGAPLASHEPRRHAPVPPRQPRGAGRQPCHGCRARCTQERQGLYLRVSLQKPNISDSDKLEN